MTPQERRLAKLEETHQPRTSACRLAMIYPEMTLEERDRVLVAAKADHESGIGCTVVEFVRASCQFDA